MTMTPSTLLRVLDFHPDFAEDITGWFPLTRSFESNNRFCQEALHLACLKARRVWTHLAVNGFP